MLRLDDYAMYSLKRIYDMRKQVQKLSEEMPMSLQKDGINLIGSILMIESNLVAYIINQATGSIMPQTKAFTQDILKQANWQTSWHLEIDQEILDDMMAQHRAAQEKGYPSVPEFTRDGKMRLHYGYSPALVIEELYQAGLDTTWK